MKHRFLAIIDDETSIRQFVAHVIAEAGYAAQEFTDGRDFLDHHHPATSGVILGIRMPVLNGVDTLYEMRRRKMKLPVLTISGGLSLPEVPDILRIGSKMHLPKPFSVYQMLAALGRVMG